MRLQRRQVFQDRLRQKDGRNTLRIRKAVWRGRTGAVNFYHYNILSAPSKSAWKKLKKLSKTFKKPLDKEKGMCYNVKAVAKAGQNTRASDKPKGIESEQTDREKTSKKFEKLFKNLLTNLKRCGIITRSARKADDKRSLKIEQ